ncbi:MAG TPA: branched-chain amino acid ABC transporter permease [Sulfurospirillum arcachonense]|nr:branched-chain amino acid ABC transporter permease [Sulfurospirillum arcachonense]HIP43991.1 branched-chain amino acid ABC transporter permease [Sulfurospirillum arcachonense]
MIELFGYLLSGVTVGFIYTLVGLGFTVIYNSSGIINFSQGEFVMAGGMSTVFLIYAGLPLGVAFVLAILITSMIGIVLYKLISFSRDSSQISLIILTLGFAIFLRGLAQIIFDKQLHTMPSFVGEGAFEIFETTLSYQALLIMVVASAIVISLYLFFQKTKTGQAMVAASNNVDAAKLMGINIKKILILNFAISAVIASIGGILLTPITSTSYEVGIMLGLKGFCAAIIGGLGTPFGAVAGGLLLGILESLVAGYISSEYKDAVAFVVLLAILFFMPGGIFGNLKSQRV